MNCGQQLHLLCNALFQIWFSALRILHTFDLFYVQFLPLTFIKSINNQHVRHIDMVTIVKAMLGIL